MCNEMWWSCREHLHWSFIISFALIFLFEMWMGNLLIYLFKENISIDCFLHNILCHYVCFITSWRPWSKSTNTACELRWHFFSDWLFKQCKSGFIQKWIWALYALWWQNPQIREPLHTAGTNQRMTFQLMRFQEAFSVFITCEGGKSVLTPFRSISTLTWGVVLQIMAV